MLVVQTAKRDPLLIDTWHRLLAELRIHHFETEIAELGETEDLAEALAETARAREAIAAIALIHRNATAAVDVWLIDRMTGKTTLRRILVSPGEEAANVLAIRAVDLLRASFREFGAWQRPPEDVANVDRRPIPGAVESLSVGPRPTVSLTAGAMMLVQFPGFGAAFGPALGASVRTTDRLSVGLLVAGPLLGSEFSAASGSASLTQAIGLLEARFSMLQVHRFEVGPSLTLGAHHLEATGQALPPLLSKDDSTWAVMVGGGLFLQTRLWGHLAANLSSRLFGTLPRVGVRVGEDLAMIRFPMLEASVGLAVGL